MNIQTIPQTKSAWFMAQLNKALETGDDAFLTKQMYRFEPCEDSNVAQGIMQIAQAEYTPFDLFIDGGLREELIDRSAANNAIIGFYKP